MGLESKRRILAGLLAVAITSEAWAQEVKLTSPQSEVVMQEPVFLRVICEYTTPPEKLPSFALMVNGKESSAGNFSCGMVQVEEPDGKGGTRLRMEGSCHLGELGFRIDSGDGSTCTYESLRELAQDLEKHFPGPGQYKIAARERNSGAVSKELTITVKEGTAGDRAVADALKGLYKYAAARTQGERAERMRNGEAAVRKAVAAHPRSPIAKYARFHLLKWETDSERMPYLKSNAPEELARVRAFHNALLERYRDLPEALPSPSQAHFEAAMALAGSRAWQGDLAGTREELLKLDRIYGKHPMHGKGIRPWLESVEQKMKPK